MKNLLIVGKSVFTLVKVMALVLLQLLTAIFTFNAKIVLSDIKVLAALALTCVFITCEYIYIVGILIGIALRQDEDKFNNEYEKYSFYFRSLHNKIENNYNQMYNLQDLVNLKINL